MSTAAPRLCAPFRASLAAIRWISAAVVLIALALPAAGAASQGHRIALDHDTPRIALTGKVEVLVDTTERLTADEIRSNPGRHAFAPVERVRGALNLGHSSAAHWLRVQLHGRAHPDRARAPEWLLEVGYPSLDRVELYVGDARQPLVAGNRLPFSERPFAHRNLVFPLALEPGHTTTLLLRVQSEDSLTIPLTLWQTDAFVAHTQRSYAVLALYYGALAALLLYNLLLFIAIRDRSYLEYVLVVASMAIGHLSLNGFGNQFLWPNAPAWAHLVLPAGFALSGLFAAMLTRSFLDTRKHTPRLDRLLWLSAVLFGLALISLWLLPYPFGASAISILVPLFAVLAIICGIRCRLRRVPASGLYVLAWTTMLIGTAVMGARSHGWLPTNALSLHAMQVGSVLVVLLLSIALAARINSVRQEHAEAQAQALGAREQLVLTLKASERQLAQRVAERTQELELANQRLLENEKGLEHLAHHDPLTGLVNRLQLADRIEHGIARALRHNTGMALLLVDLDRFKPVNDAFGHAAGDELLIAVANRLRALVRTEDTVARLGGDEFVLLLEEVFDPEDVDRVVAAVRTELGRPFNLNAQTVRIGASVGRAFFPSDGNNATTLLKAADKMMYHVKGRQSETASESGASDPAVASSGIA